MYFPIFITVPYNLLNTTNANVDAIALGLDRLKPPPIYRTQVK